MSWRARRLACLAAVAWMIGAVCVLSATHWDELRLDSSFALIFLDVALGSVAILVGTWRWDGDFGADCRLFGWAMYAVAGIALYSFVALLMPAIVLPLPSLRRLGTNSY